MSKILLVEDNDLNRDMIARYLTFQGYSVVTAADGAEGVALARAEMPDLIIMDMSLPVLDGWKATEQIRADAGTAAIPIIALTALATAADRQRCFDVGCDEFESKPINFPALMAKMRVLLNTI
ncbi:MAG TPA: response regulator [Roseiflexaceae bacterium]